MENRLLIGRQQVMCLAITPDRHGRASLPSRHVLMHPFARFDPCDRPPDHLAEFEHRRALFDDRARDLVARGIRALVMVPWTRVPGGSVSTATTTLSPGCRRMVRGSFSRIVTASTSRERDMLQSYHDHHRCSSALLVARPWRLWLDGVQRRSRAAAAGLPSAASRAVADETAIDRTVLVQAAPTVAETAFLLDLASDHELIAAVVGWVDFEDKSHLRHLERFRRHPKFVGVRPMIQDIPDVDWMLSGTLVGPLRRLLRSISQLTHSDFPFTWTISAAYSTAIPP